MSRKNMRLLVLGDENVGKSSLIHTIYSQVSSNVQKTLKKVILPPEMCLYSREVFTQLIDTSVDMDITEEVRSSDLVLLVYDVSDPDTIARIDSDWLPKVASINPKIPIILVGNKMDKKQLEFQSEHQYIKIKDILRKVTKRYKNVQMGIQCSAFYDRNVKSVLNCAQRAVLYPLSPLYNLQEKKITPDFRKALIRIFRILDQDMDAKLHDSQMNVLQERVFHSELNMEDIKAIKQIILRELEVQQQDYIELKGFIALQKMCIEMLKIQICWSILRYFNYDDNLRIKINHNYFTVNEMAGESVELNSDAINFLMDIYNISKKSATNPPRDDASQKNIPKTVLQYVFEPCPEIFFPEFVQMTEMSQQKFLTTWSLYAFINYQKCYETLLYLGYEKHVDETFTKRKSKKSYNDFQKLKQNKVFSVLIVQSEKYRGYLEPLFIDGKKIEIVDIKNGNFTYQRTSLLYTNQNISKTFLLFKVKKDDLHMFFNDDPQSQTSFSKKIDLVIQFDEDKYQSQIFMEMRNTIPNNILYKKITNQEALTVLHADHSPKLDLKSFPITYQKNAYSAFFSEIAYKVIQNIELGLSQEKIAEFKQQKRHKKNLVLLSTASIALATCVMGAVVLKRYNIKLWNS